MKRVAISLFIVGYLGALTFGLFCHALNFKTGDHPVMYFLVWDMYCGWSGYETRQHVIGEGESGTYYDLTDTPWGSITPYGGHPRQTHDYAGTFVMGMAQNALRQTQHESIIRLFHIDEAWPRKYNLPDDLWEQRYSEPKEWQPYYQVRQVATPGGQILERKPAWLTLAHQSCIIDNPRLRRDMSKGRQYYAVSPSTAREVVTPTSYELPVESD